MGSLHLFKSNSHRNHVYEKWNLNLWKVSWCLSHMKSEFGEQIWNCHCQVVYIKLVCLYIQTSMVLRLKNLTDFNPYDILCQSANIYCIIISITTDTLGQVILLGVEVGCPIHCRTLLNVLGFYLLDSSSIHPITAIKTRLQTIPNIPRRRE